MSEPPSAPSPLRQIIRLIDPAEGPLLVKRMTDQGNLGAARAALDNERRILQRLQGLPGCPRLLGCDLTIPELTVADPGGVALAESGLLGQVDLTRFLAIAEALARMVAAIHERGVIHQAIAPSHILIGPADDQLWFLDFARATTFAEERPELTHTSRLAGTPAYWSPEQTGRMNRPVDYRTDLYSLGLTLYALVTGAPPFEETDPLALIHAHLARDPASPQGRAPWLPDVLARAILILLAKEPDDRYQSAAGLVHDLQHLRQAVAARAALDTFNLRKRDPPLSPRPPRRLYGRDRELATLMNSFMAVIEDQSQALFVAGYAGVGKTALIQEIHRPVTLNRGLFACGKCEQFQRDRPFLAPARALGQLCQLLLAETESRVDEWRTRILAGVGPDASALFEIIPDLEALLGAQPPAPPLDPLATQVRLRALLVALVRQIAAPDRPLVLFLDDLQWAGQPTLDVIGALLEDAAMRGLLLLGAYRDHEVDATHPLASLLRRTTATGAPPPVMTLTDLDLDALTALLADMLRLPVTEGRSLAACLHEKTAGNPFFTFELLNALHRAGVVRLDREQGHWVWEDAALRAYPVSVNLVDLLASGLAELATATTETLVAAACLGNACTLGLLALATGEEPRVLTERLMPALERGILVTPSALAFHQADASVALRFCHDRMQQAVYQIRDESGRRRLHLALARRFVQAGDDPCHQFSAAEHYAVALPLIVDATEQTIAHRLFLNAARQVSQSGAFASAERFLRLGIDLLAADAWRCDPVATLTLHAERHAVLCRLTRHAEADALYDLLAARASSPQQLVDSACEQIASLSSRVRHEEAVALGCALLDRLGLPIPLADLDRSLQEFLADFPDVFRLQAIYCQDTRVVFRADSAIALELESFHRHVAAGALEQLHTRQDLADERLASSAKLMNRMVYAANSTVHSMLAPWLLLRLGRLWIEHGYCPATVFPLAAASITIIGFRGDYALAERLSRTALAVGVARECWRETARSRFIDANYIGHWWHPLEQTLVCARRAFDELLRVGDLEFAALTFYASQSALLDTAGQLADLRAENATALTFARKIGSGHAEQSYLPCRQLIRALEGQTREPGSFTDADFDESTHQAAVSNDPMARGYFHLYRALAACLFGDEAALAQHAEAAGALYIPIACHYATAMVNLLLSLALIQRLGNATAAEQPVLLERLASNQRWLKTRAADAPVNFAHLYDLVEAERLDALDQPWAALQSFEQAMRRAQAHQRPWHYALITERAGWLHMRHGLEHCGRTLLTRAYHLYRQWGATGKASAMRHALPFVAISHPGDLSRHSEDNLDQAALLRASAALASETSRGELVARVMELVGQLIGATDVCFLAMNEEGQWLMEGGIRGGERLGRMVLADAATQGGVSTSVLRLGLASQRPVVSDDAVLDSRFAADPHFADMPLCSLLGLPVVVQGRVSAFLILENRRLRAAFSAQRVVDLLGGGIGDVPLLQSLHLASLGSLVALHSVLDARNQALRDTRQQALEEVARERAIREQQSQFIDLVTHEYRTPLAILQTNLDILRLTQEPAYWRNSLRNMEQAIQRLGEVFDGSLRRGDWGDWGDYRPMRLESIELSTWLGQRIDEARIGWPAPAPSIDLRVSGPAVIQADPALLKTVLINLLDNARKYGPATGIIAVDLTVENGQVALTVGNDCPFDLEHDAADLLNKAVRGANSQGIPGLGMGLYLVNRLVSDQGGQVERLRGRPGRFEIRLTFPANQQGASA
jgi:predicted ATPase/signal transduction histidine kinase